MMWLAIGMTRRFSRGVEVAGIAVGGNHHLIGLDNAARGLEAPFVPFRAILLTGALPQIAIVAPRLRRAAPYNRAPDASFALRSTTMPPW